MQLLFSVKKVFTCTLKKSRLNWYRFQKSFNSCPLGYLWVGVVVVCTLHYQHRKLGVVDVHHLHCRLHVVGVLLGHHSLNYHVRHVVEFFVVRNLPHQHCMVEVVVIHHLNFCRHEDEVFVDPHSLLFHVH